MKKTFRIIVFMVALLPFMAGTQSFTIPQPIPAPNGMTIILTNTTALDYGNPSTYCYHELKILFYGSRYSDGQDVWDPNSPFEMDPMYFTNPAYCLCSNFYYQDGRAVVYTREDDESSWVYQGDMFMSSSNCTKDGDKVTFFTVNCMYLSNP